jgi:AcrR family transcriptional regulator
MAGRRRRGEICAETGRRAAARGALWDGGKARAATEIRLRIMDAMLHACGRQGYRSVSVQDVIDGYGGYRGQFYRCFTSKAACYAAAYEEGIEHLCTLLFDACAAQPSWREGLHAALLEVGRLLEDDPMLARGLLIEVYAAGGPALEKREEVFERLTRAIDGARRETESRHSPPPVTATFMLGAIHATATNSLEKGKPGDFAAAVPELVEMIAGAFI